MPRQARGTAARRPSRRGAPGSSSGSGGICARSPASRLANSRYAPGHARPGAAGRTRARCRRRCPCRGAPTSRPPFSGGSPGSCIAKAASRSARPTRRRSRGPRSCTQPSKSRGADARSARRAAACFGSTGVTAAVSSVTRSWPISNGQGPIGGVERGRRLLVLYCTTSVPPVARRSPSAARGASAQPLVGVEGAHADDDRVEARERSVRQRAPRPAASRRSRPAAGWRGPRRPARGCSRCACACVASVERHQLTSAGGARSGSGCARARSRARAASRCAPSHVGDERAARRPRRPSPLRGGVHAGSGRSRSSPACASSNGAAAGSARQPGGQLRARTLPATPPGAAASTRDRERLAPRRRGT